MFPEVNRLAVKTRGALMRGSIRESRPLPWGDPSQRTIKFTTTEKYTRTGLPFIRAGR
jgi:hypothetical protein